MGRTLVFNTKHDLGLEGAKAAIDARYDAIVASPAMEMAASADKRWEGDTAHIHVKALGSKGEIEIAVTAEKVTVTVRLPTLLVPFAGMIETIINSNEDALKPRPAPPE